MITTKKTMRELDDIYSYEKQALDLIPFNHPHREEIRRLLVDQINDELHDYATTTRPYSRTSATGEGSDQSGAEESY